MAQGQLGMSRFREGRGKHIHVEVQRVLDANKLTRTRKTSKLVATNASTPRPQFIQSATMRAHCSDPENSQGHRPSISPKSTQDTYARLSKRTVYLRLIDSEHIQTRLEEIPSQRGDDSGLNLATSRNRIGSANLRSYQQLLAQRANEEHDRNSQQAARDLRILRRRHTIANPSAHSPESSDTSTLSDLTLSPKSVTSPTRSNTLDLASPTRSNTLDITSPPTTPTTPTHNTTQTIPSITSVMSRMTYDFPLFTGDIDETTDADTKTDTPIQWLGKLERGFTATTKDDEKIYAFRVNLERGSPAQAWWQGIADTDKDTWDKVVALFKTQWPTTKPPAAGMPAKKALLLNMKLEESKLGEMEGAGKHENYTHIKWADRAQKLWKGLNDPSGHLIDQIRPNLPKALLDSIAIAAADRNDGTKFFEAIRLVDVERMMERRGELKTLRELEERVGALSVSTQNTNPLRFQPTNSPSPTTHYYQPTTYLPAQTPQQSYTPPHRRVPTTQTPPTPAPQYQQTGREVPPHLLMTPHGQQQNQLPTPGNSPADAGWMNYHSLANGEVSRLLGLLLKRRAGIESNPYPDTPDGQLAVYILAYANWYSGVVAPPPSRRLRLAGARCKHATAGVWFSRAGMLGRTELINRTSVGSLGPSAFVPSYAGASRLRLGVLHLRVRVMSLPQISADWVCIGAQPLIRRYQLDGVRRGLEFGIWAVESRY
ncbi:hypothetical protein FIBSPDRAFT_882047 [Athelia psychrophila]|uniref:Retrotransposon gag domain-containing protein n=1 Tax=Athelia psychrophila TaxID=1759441 RepID=A0A166W1U5_9AGAM|nr:hypothetical protein FIBSPDRAFT_882047 [Fibularhizoctonia sp. CBS 109695]